LTIVSIALAGIASSSRRSNEPGTQSTGEKEKFMTNWQRRSLSCALALASSACGEVSCDERAEAGIGAETAELKNGKLFGSSAVLNGAVRLHIWRESSQTWTTCSGQVISKQSILTAAHCVNVIDSNPGWTYVQAWHQTSTGWLLILPTTWVTIHYNPSFNGVDAKYDVGLVTAPTVQPLQHLTQGDAHALAKSIPSGESMYAMGYGYFGSGDSDVDGQGRYGKVTPTYDPAKLDYVFVSGPTSPELCSGDSGGPLKSAFSGPLLVYGVASRGTGPGFGHCRAHSHWATVQHNLAWLKPRIVGACFETATLYSCW
jgi:V8-like Glu-specific endopeptidase